MVSYSGTGWEWIALVVLFWSVWLINRAVRQSAQPEYAIEKGEEARIMEGSDIA